MHFQVLGPLEVTREGERLPLGGPKQRLVLAHMLIRADEVVSADVLIDEIWGEDPPDAARPSLYSYVSHLRRALGADRLVHRAPGYVLHVAPDEIDAARFESLVAQGRRRIASDPASAARILREALALWRGEPLADLSTEVSLQGEIERLDAMHLGALEDRIEADLAVGRQSELVPELERMVARYPLRERLCGQLMLALYRGGRQSDALTVYHRLRRALDAELGLEPSPAIEEVQRRILNHDPALELRGEPLRGYRILEQIGSGPLGVVHRAVEPQTEREVAVKVLGAGRANDAGFVRRFQADARRVARLDHPHIVPLFDWWREPDAAYLIMRLMRGGSLADRLRNGQPSSALALRWAEQIGSALTSAHHQGVVHGDIRPENVLLDAEDNVYLSDFAVGCDPALEAAGRRDLKNRYVAPERRAGAPPSPAADVYGFGVLLAELLSGVTIGDAAAELRAALEGATAATPGERPTSAADLGASVRQALLTRAPATPRADGRVYTLRNPYKGLRAFEEADEADFFGREDLVRRLAERLDEGGEAPRFLAVVGPSGSGKSSVVSAGLIPALRAGAVPGSEEWFVAVMSPGERPFEQLEQALLSVAVGAPLALAELLEARGGLREAIERVLPPGAELLLVIDQFEELFTLVSDEAVQRRFLDVMARTIDDASSRTRLVITLRADFYDRPLRHEWFGRQLAARTHAVPPLTAGDLERVIAQPAERSGLRLEQGLVARIVAEMSEQPGALPLLQYALTELWERREGRRLSLPAYDSSGGIAAAVGRRAEQLVNQLDAAGRETARQLFLRLVELGEGTPDTARRVRRSELLALASDAHRIEAVIDMFSRYRLLLFDRDLETREATVELAHEALLHAWPGLQRWVDEARGDLRQQRRLATAAGQWREAGRDPSFLLSGSRLEQAEQWAESTSVVLVPAEREYVAASIAERVRLATEEERRRAHEAELEHRAVTRLRALVVTLALAALLAGGLSVFALSEGQRAAREARFATARELAAAAVANLEVDAERSILLALAAIDATRYNDRLVLPEAEEALHRAVVASRIILTVPGVGGDLDLSPDGRLFVTEGPESSGLIEIRSAETGESLLVFHGHDVDVNSVAFSPDGSMLATTGDDSFLRVWDTATGQELASLRGGPNGQVFGPSFSPDGTLAAAAWPNEERVRLLDLRGGEPMQEIRVVGEPLSTSFSPDGTRLAVAMSGLFPGRAVVVGVGSGRELLSLEGHHSWHVVDVAWSPDGRSVATASMDGTAVIWDAETGAPRLAVVGHAASVVSVDWSADATRLVTGSHDGTARVWEITDLGVQQLHVLRAQGTSGLTVAAISADGGRVMTGDGAITAVKIWDVGLSGSSEWATVPGHWDALGGVDFVEGRLVADRGGGWLGVWDSESWQEVQRIGPWRGVVQAIGVSPDGALIAAANWEDPAIVWDAVTGRQVFAGQLPSEDVAWSSDGQLLAMAQELGPVNIVDRSGRHVADLGGEPGMYMTMARFSPDGRLLATDYLPDGRPLTENEDIAERDFGVRIWDWQTGSVLQTLSTSPRELAFDPTGTRLAVGRDDGFGEIWDVESGELLATLTGMGGGAVTGVSFSPDGALLATGSRDGAVRLWDAQTARQLLILSGHKGGIWRVKFSPDGSKLASSSHDGTVRVWAVILEDLIEIAHRKLTRDLTEGECRQYLHVETCAAVAASADP